MRGGVPNAKIAVYKTCWKIINKQGEEFTVCPEHTVLKAIDDAIEDKVDIISYSQGLPYPRPLQEDCISCAFLRALEKGILTSTSAGNLGRENYYAVTNGAPWVMTVAASSKDRFFETKLELEEEDEPITISETDRFFDSQVFNTINTFETQDSFYPLLKETASAESTRKRELIADKHSVKIHKTVKIPREEGWIPNVANLSSRGPNCDNFLANILKPDIAAPGLDIVADWPENVKLLSDVPAYDYRHHRFNMLSGTSMACPHATGLALYLKSFKPSWSPSVIKSALMMTSTVMEGLGNELAYGSGFLNATKVLDPGLIYETKHQDYIDYMCKQGYNTEKLRSHVGNYKIDCSATKIDHNADLYYPTMTARVNLNTKFTKVFYRNVTNVGDRKSTYIGKIKF